VLGVFEDFDSPSTLAFLERYPRPARLSAKQIERVLRKSRHPRAQAKAQQMAQALNETRLLVDDFTVRAKSRLVITLVEQLQTLQTRVSEYEQEIADLFAKHPDAAVIESLPGAGPKNGPRLLVELGDNRERYENPDQLQCEAGTCPVTHASGKSRWVTMRRACRMSFRDTMHQFSFSSLQHSLWARHHYDALRARGAAHAAALRGVSDKWLKIIYHLWTTQQKYNEDVFLAARQRHQLQMQAAQP
jgi:transposase